jgi:hypothetical protein
MKYTKIIKNFITDDEVKLLNKWTLDHYKEPYFSDPKMNNDDHQTRFTTRHAIKLNYKVKYPKVVYNIQKRLIKHFRIKQEQIVPPPQFTDGIVTGIAFSPGGCLEHCDPTYHEDTFTLHCNFITQNPEHGGVTYVEGVPYETKEGDLIMYLASHAKHRVTDITGKTPRILWICGFCVFDFQIPYIFKPNNFLY